MNASIYRNVRRRIAVRWSSVLILLLAWRALGLDPAKTLYQYNCRSWSRQNGLPANGVSAITQTRDGYIWLGTPMGLVRFDGVEFKSIDMGGLRSTIINSLCSSASGGLWLGLDRGAFAFCDGKRIGFRGRPEWGGEGLSIHAILETQEHDIWLAGQNLTGKLTGGKDYVPVLNSPGGKDFYDNSCVYQDSEGRVWLGTTSRGLYWWSKGVLTKFPDPALDELTIYSVVEDRRGQLWVGTHRGLLCYDAKFQRVAAPFPWFETRALAVDREGTVWAGTSGNGVVRFTGGTGAGVSFGKANGLPDDFVTALAQDREGSMWIGTRNGLSQLSDVKIPTLGKTEGLTADVILSVFPSRKGGLWMATSQGITRYADGNAQTYGMEAGLGNSWVKRVHEARDGDVYLINGSMEVEVLSGSKVVARYPNKTWPTALTEDDRGVIVSVGGELYRVGTNYFEPCKFSGKQVPTKCWMFNLATGRDGSLWTASAEGICRVKDGAVEVLTGPDPLGNCKANCLCEDDDGVMWAGLETGIARIKNGQVRVISQKHGLLDNLIYSLVCDDTGSLWGYSGRGFFRVSRRSLNDVADGKASHVACVAYNSLEAVKSFERNQQELSGCKTSDGRIWFPTAQGLAVIDPGHITIDPVPPAVYVDKVRINGKEKNRAVSIVAKPGAGDLEIHYTALSYRAPQKIQFRYRLEGRDTAWTEAGERRLAIYTNLKPGSYRFHVIAANADGIWNTTGEFLDFRLLPQFYQAVWFYFVSAAAALGLIAAGYAWRIRHLKRREKALQETRDYLDAKVKERTAELATANAQLKGEIHHRKNAQNQVEGQKSKLEKEIEERKRMEIEVERVHRQLIDASRHAGQAEVASNVLHNVGNVLNSVNVSTTLLSDRLRRLQISNVARAAHILQEHHHDLAQFLTTDQKGRKLPQYLNQLARHLGKEQEELVLELKELAENVEHIKEIVAMQQNYARVSGILEKVPADDLIESALKMHAAAYMRHSIQVERQFDPLPPIVADRHKVLQILINILHNAKYACQEAGRADKRVRVKLQRRDPDRVLITITDNGVGIAAENLTRIFSHGFTTRKNGHGFGLHSAALAAQEMGGTLSVHSDGLGTGATFALELPMNPANTDGVIP
ncbi:MAG TPA: two-component regulator propeller domain-containing protein [Verrucomicrobiae bacterium]|nr:two-component regulator propeller domain-containing protein [Verrucomicrobiae bacterium]